MKRFFYPVFTLIGLHLQAQQTFDGLDVTINNLSRLSDAVTRSISPENITGEKGRGGMANYQVDGGKRNVANAYASRELGQGWKNNPYLTIGARDTITLAEIKGPGAIQSIWMTPTGNWRTTILRFYWDDEHTPSVEVPVGDFFCMGWGEYAPVVSAPVTVNPGSAFNCYWKMPFRKKCKITMENRNPRDTMRVFYQINYVLTPIADDEGYFHAQFRRSNPTEGSIHTVIDNVKGKGQYVGTYLAFGANNSGWWGEGEIKFFLDGDKDFATIVGTGTEDYFCGSFNFENKLRKEYEVFNTPYAGMPQVLKPDGLYRSQQRFGLYRWHIPDPIRFHKDLSITLQDLGWQSNSRYYQQHSDIATVAFWYQREPHAAFPVLQHTDVLEYH